VAARVPPTLTNANETTPDPMATYSQSEMTLPPGRLVVTWTVVAGVYAGAIV
jgi:hypothetical protein